MSGPVTPASRPPRLDASRIKSLAAEHWIIALMVGGAFVVCVLNLASGHDWGDDFAQYISQAKAIVAFELDPVVESNMFTKDHSSWSNFAPLTYPWGFPLLLAPLYAIWGINFGVFQIVQCLFFAAFVGLIARIFIPRVGRPAGLLLVLLLGSSVVYIGWAQSVTSDFPYLAFMALTLLLAERARRAGALTGASIRLLIGLGLTAGFATSIRTEGLVLFLAIAAVQLAALFSDRRDVDRADRKPFWRGLPWKPLVLPHAAGLALLVLFQVVFPGPFRHGYPGTGIGQLKGNAIWFRDPLAHMIGLMDLGASSLRFAGSEIAAKWMLGIFVVAATVGLLVRLIKAWREDAAIVAYLVFAVLVVGVLPFHAGRYLFTITPFLVYFAYQGLAATTRLLVGRFDGGRAAILPSLVAGAFIVLLLVPNVTDLRRRTGILIGYDSYIVWGPTHPASEEMFAKVREVVPEDDVVAFFRGRAMNLFGERQGLYLTVLDQILERADWYAMQKNSGYSQYLLTTEEADANGITALWENNRFILWRVP